MPRPFAPRHSGLPTVGKAPCQPHTSITQFNACDSCDGLRDCLVAFDEFIAASLHPFPDRSCPRLGPPSICFGGGLFFRRPVQQLQRG